MIVSTNAVFGIWTGVKVLFSLFKIIKKAGNRFQSRFSIKSRNKTSLSSELYFDLFESKVMRVVTIFRPESLSSSIVSGTGGKLSVVSAE